MRFSLKSYRDCGKCAYATLMDEFDSEKDEIRLNGKKVEIKSLDDLFPFLWNIPGICCHDNVKHASVSDFYSTGTWWEHRYDESIKEHEKEIDKLEKRLKKAADSRKPKIQEQLAYEKESIKTLRRIIRRHNEEMEELKEAIRVDNKS
jgi:hypothetical protein